MRELSEILTCYKNFELHFILNVYIEIEKKNFLEGNNNVDIVFDELTFLNISSSLYFYTYCR